MAKETYTVIHHTGGRQNINNPSEIGGKYKFYNIIISPTGLFKQHAQTFNRGAFYSFNVSLTGDFTKDTPTTSQLELLNKVVDEYHLPTIGHGELKEYGATIGTLQTECPGNIMSYIKAKLRVLVINDNKTAHRALQGVTEALDGRIDWDIKHDNLDIKPTTEIMGTDEAFKIVDSLPDADITILFYPKTTSYYSYASTSQSNKKKVFIQAHDTSTEAMIKFEIAHALQRLIRGAGFPMSIADTYSAPEEMLKEKLKAIKPFIPFLGREEYDMLTLEQMRKLYALWGLNDPEGEAYWVGKTLDELLNARINDFKKELERVS